jgi:hypothetical protein
MNDGAGHLDTQGVATVPYTICIQVIRRSRITTIGVVEHRADGLGQYVVNQPRNSRDCVLGSPRATNARTK